MLKIISSILVTCLWCLTASAQTAVATPEPQTLAASAPLNLDSAAVVQEMGKETYSDDTKPAALSSTQNDFEQILLKSEGRKKISGFVEGGAGTGTISGQRGIKSERINCEHTSAAVNDAVSKVTQVEVAALVETCRAK